MFNKLKSYFFSLSRWKDIFFHTNSYRIDTDRTYCINIDSQSFSIIAAHYDKEKININLCATYPFTTREDLFISLASIVKYHQLDVVNCSWILQPDQYQLLLIETLPVTANEFQSAIRWKIKDLLRFPIDDVIIDSFPLPIKKVSTGQEMIMVVAAKSSDLKSMTEQLKEIGLHINKISIPELSLRNIAALFEQPDQITALIYMQEKNSQIILTSNKELHFARRIELGVKFIEPVQKEVMDEIEIAKKMDKLASEIQRSFDYYQSQWRKSMPTRIIFASVKILSIDIASLLSQYLAIPTEVLNITPYLNNTNMISIEEQGKYLTMIGELFQNKGNSYAAAN